MAQFRLEIKIHKRGENGSGIMQKACYNARETLYDDEVGLHTKIPCKTKVEELAYQKIYLPAGADVKFLNRETLWNKVQTVEKAKGSQMAREFVGNLPNELPLKQQIAILDEFAKYLSNQGMICDAVLHNKKGNVGFHILCPMRRLKDNGKEFAVKRANAYICHDSKGNTKYFVKVAEINKYNEEHQTDFVRTPLLDKNGNQKMRIRKGRKPTPQWERIPIDLTGWNDAVNKRNFANKIKTNNTSAEKWRTKLCEIGNKYLNENNKWNHLSYKRQGLDVIPTKHEGAKVQWLEKKEQQRVIQWNKNHPNNQKEYKPVTDIRKHNVAIQKRNNLVVRITNQLKKYKSLLHSKLQQALHLKQNINNYDSIQKNLALQDERRLESYRKKLQEPNYRKTFGCLKRGLTNREYSFLTREQKIKYTLKRMAETAPLKCEVEESKSRSFIYSSSSHDSPSQCKTRTRSYSRGAR